MSSMKRVDTDSNVHVRIGVRVQLFGARNAESVRKELNDIIFHSSGHFLYSILKALLGPGNFKKALSMFE